MKTTKIVCILLMMAIFIQPVSAMHWIAGRIDGADNSTVIMYYPENPENYISTMTGQLDCPGGDASEYYMLNVHMIPNDEQYFTNNWLGIGRNVTIAVISDRGCVLDSVNVTMSEYGWDLAPTMTLRK